MEGVENKLLRKMGKIGTSSGPSGCSEKTSSGSFHSGTRTASSSARLYSCGSSSSAFGSVPIAPPAKAVDVFGTIEKAPSRLELDLRVAVAHSI